MNNNNDTGGPQLRVLQARRPRNILIANLKGGCGKTTIATNLASYFANSGKSTALMDYDPQGSSCYWLQLRPESAAPISGIIVSNEHSGGKTRNFQRRLPRNIDRVIVDTPAGLAGTELYHRLSEADMVIVPILPSPIDIHSADLFIHNIQMSGCLREGDKKLLVVANRVRKNTVMFTRLNEFLQELGLPRVTYLRDSQLYTKTAAVGLGVPDLTTAASEQERDHWFRIGSWIDNQLAMRQYEVDHQRSGYNSNQS